MNKLKILLTLLGIGLTIKIGLYQFCKMIDKPFTNHSTTLKESISSNFLIKNYQLTEISRPESLDLKREFNLSSIFIENNWDFECSLWRIDKVPTKVNGQNVVLPMNVQDVEILDKYIFYLVSKNDTITLMGNRTKETVYTNKTWGTFGELSNSELLIKDKKGTLPTRRFKIQKEKN